MMISLTMFFWIMLGIGFLISIMSLLMDDFLDSLGLDTLGIAMFFAGFGGTGLILNMFIDNRILLLLISALVGLLCYIFIYFYVAPKLKTETSIATSVEDLKGAKGKVTIQIPVNGLGQVRLSNGIYHETRPAKSLENKVIEQGEEVVVIEVVKGVIHVTEVVKEKI